MIKRRQGLRRRKAREWGKGRERSDTNTSQQEDKKNEKPKQKRVKWSKGIVGPENAEGGHQSEAEVKVVRGETERGRGNREQRWGS